MTGNGPLGIDAEIWQARERFLIEYLQLDTREMRAQAAVRAVAKGKVGLVFARQVEPLRVREFRWIEIGEGQKQQNDVALFIVAP